MIPYTQAKAITFKEVTSGGGGGTPKLIDLSIQTQPTTTSYKVGDTFTLDGLVLYALYEGDFWKDVTELCTPSIAAGYEFTEDDVDIDTVTLRYSENGVSASAEYGIEVSASDLPAGYSDVEYIMHSAYNELVLTKWNWSSVGKAELDLQITGVVGTSSVEIIGYYSSSSAKANVAIPNTVNSKVLKIFVNGTSQSTNDKTLGDTYYNRHRLGFDPRNYLIYQDDVSYTVSSAWRNLLQAYPIRLFSNASSKYYVKANIYGIKIYSSTSSSTLQADYRPCKRDSDGQAGFYDIINDEFIYGTGFTAP